MVFRNRAFCVLASGALFLTAIAAAQTEPAGSGSPPYQPAVPAGSMNFVGGFYGGNSGASTAAGSAMNGMAHAVNAMGNYNLSTSAAAVNMTQARRNAIQNSAMYTDTYFQMRAANRAYRAAEAGPRPTSEQIARIARSGVPRPLSPGDVDTVTGRIHWPAALQQESFAGQRATLDEFAAQVATYGSLSLSDQMAARRSIEAMFADLKAQIAEIPPQQYVASRSFLNSLIHATANTAL